MGGNLITGGVVVVIMIFAIAVARDRTDDETKAVLTAVLSAASVWWVFNVLFTNGLIPYTVLGSSFVKLLQGFFGVRLPSMTGISLSPTLIILSLGVAGRGIVMAAWYSERR